MRTDAKIGFAIGAVLLAVLTVYAIVVPKHKKTSNTTVSLVQTPTASSSDSSGTPPPMVVGDSTPTIPAPAVSSTPGKDSAATIIPPSASALADSTPAPGAGEFHPMDSSAKETIKGDDKAGKLMDGVYTPPAESDHSSHAKAQHASLPDESDTAIGNDRVYTIKHGQTLSIIAYEVYGNSRFWVAIVRENKGLNPNRLKVGTKINLPDITPIEPGPISTVSDEQMATPAAQTHSHIVAPVEPIDGHSYIVKSGDSLYGIARRLLGSGHKADTIYALNKDLIGTDKSRLKLGMVLKLPETGATALAATTPMR